MHAVGLTIFALAENVSVLHSARPRARHRGIATARCSRTGAATAAAFVSVGLITSSALLVHIWGGVIEGHFHFFVMIALLALYEDWFPFLLAAAYVVVHHGLMGALDPGGVYNHSDGCEHPWKWALIHGGFVVGGGHRQRGHLAPERERSAETQKAYGRRGRARSVSGARSRTPRSAW